MKLSLQILLQGENSKVSSGGFEEKEDKQTGWKVSMIWAAKKLVYHAFTKNRFFGCLQTKPIPTYANIG